MSDAESYLQELRQALPVLYRRRLVAEMREHFASAAERREEERVTIERLGPAHVLAEQLVADLRAGSLGPAGRIAAVLTGSRLALVRTAAATLVIAGLVAGALLSVSHTSRAPSAVQRTVALRQVGTLYTRGGAPPAQSFDAAGNLQRTHEPIQVREISAEVSRKDLQPGDLLYVDGNQLLGIYIGNGQYVDAVRDRATRLTK